MNTCYWKPTSFAHLNFFLAVSLLCKSDGKYHSIEGLLKEMLTLKLVFDMITGN